MSDEPIDNMEITDDLDEFTNLLEGRGDPPVDTDDNVDNVEPEQDVEEPVEAEQEEHTEEQVEEDEGKKKKPNRFQERINELTAKAREAERALAELRAEKERKTVDETPKQTTQVPVSDGPTPDDKNSDGSDKYPLGEFDPTYIRDLARHTIETEWKAKEEEQAKQAAAKQEQEVREALQEQWVQNLQPVTEKYEDFLDKTMQLEDAFNGLDDRYSDYLVQTIKSLDNGPEVLYYFANNLAEAKRIVQSGPLTATLALGEINAMFKKDQQPAKTTTKKTSSAPPPPPTNKGTKQGTSVRGDEDDLDAFASALFSKKRR